MECTRALTSQTGLGAICTMCVEKVTAVPQFTKISSPAQVRKKVKFDQTLIQNALCNGEDFELLLAVEAGAAKKLLNVWSDTVILTQIGNIREHLDGCILIGPDGASRPLPDEGYEHSLGGEAQRT